MKKARSDDDYQAGYAQGFKDALREARDMLELHGSFKTNGGYQWQFVLAKPEWNRTWRELDLEQ